MLDDARTRMKAAVDEILHKYGSLVQRVEWADDGNRAKLSGVGVEVEKEIRRFGRAPVSRPQKRRAFGHTERNWSAPTLRRANCLVAPHP